MREASSSVLYNFFLYTSKVKDKNVTRSSVFEQLPKTPSETKVFFVSTFMYCTQKEKLHDDNNIEN